MRNRCYFSKAGFETMRADIEEYVKERGVVIREELIERFKYRGHPMNNRQLGYIVAYSEKKGVLTSFVWHNGRRIFDSEYYVTTLDNFTKFTRGIKNG